LVVSEHVDLGHVNWAKDADLIEQRVDNHSLNCIEEEVKGVLAVFWVAILVCEEKLVNSLSQFNGDASKDQEQVQLNPIGWDLCAYLLPLKYLKILNPRRIYMISENSKNVTYKLDREITYMKKGGSLVVDLIWVELESLVNHSELEKDCRIENDRAKNVTVFEGLHYAWRLPSIEDFLFFDPSHESLALFTQV
jgi:hypothetical protein